MWTWLFGKKHDDVVAPAPAAVQNNLSLLDYRWQAVGVRVIINELSGFSVGAHGVIVDTPVGKLHDQDVVWVHRDGSGPDSAVFFYHHELDKEPVLFPPIDPNLINK